MHQNPNPAAEQAADSLARKREAAEKLAAEGACVPVDEVTEAEAKADEVVKGIQNTITTETKKAEAEALERKAAATRKANQDQAERKL